VSLYLKESLGAPSQILARFTEAIFERHPVPRKRSTVTLLSRPRSGDAPVQIRVPIGALAQELEERLPIAEKAPDRPRGRRRAGWSSEFVNALQAAGDDLGNISEEEVMSAVRAERARKRMMPEVSIVGEKAKKASTRRR
jgi:hypothetical protein